MYSDSFPGLLIYQLVKENLHQHSIDILFVLYNTTLLKLIRHYLHHNCVPMRNNENSSLKFKISGVRIYGEKVRLLFL
jgi:hypothetical protein